MKMLLVALLVFTVAACTPQDIAASCTQSGGEWDSIHNECATMDAAADIRGFCEQNNGAYQECASACRHNPDADFCIQVCVQVCAINQAA
jgi:hypothetical protein